jgi:maltooligosyltrehalose trehalohydrolase
VLGAVPQSDGAVELTVWAPNARSLAAHTADGAHPLDRGDDGIFTGSFPGGHGDEYLLCIDDGDTLPDPCSRAQPYGVRGPSAVVDTRRFEGERLGLTLDELVVYELHVGTFTDEGTFDAAAARLPQLRELGVSSVEVMPVATFPGERGWGYDGLYTSAPHPEYGGPEGFARFVRRAHEANLGVILDVVYNHVGPGNEALTAFAPYFSSKHETFWGDALDYATHGVREWAAQNAELWIRDYHVDGLRLDAVHAIFDDSAEHICAEIKRRVGDALVISEMEIGDWRPIDEWGHDAQWADQLHHELHVLLTGERDGYYADYGSIHGLVDALRGFGHDPRRLVVCAQNHDQVGNRALGDRLAPDALRVAAAVYLFSTCTPMLFMGEEHFEEHPFQFFTDHIDPKIAEATREGRKQEFESFTSFSGAEIPDPQDVQTFLHSKLSEARAPDPVYRRLLELHRKLPRELEIVEANDDAKRLRLRRGHVVLDVDFANRTVAVRD